MAFPCLSSPHGPGRFLCISSPAGLRDRLPSSARWRAGSVAIAVWHATAVISQLSVQRPPRALLISDLGRPARFLAMLRVFKKQSPMSVGAWILAAFGTSAAASAFAEMLDQRFPWLPLRIVGNLVGRYFRGCRPAVFQLHGRADRRQRNPGVERECRNAAHSFRYVGTKFGGCQSSN